MAGRMFYLHDNCAVHHSKRQQWSAVLQQKTRVTCTRVWFIKQSEISTLLERVADFLEEDF